MMKAYFTDMEAGIVKAISEGNSSHRKLYTLELARLGKRLYSGADSIAWCGITAPFDLLNAMGVTSCFVEFIGAMLALTGSVGPFIEETDHIGYSARPIRAAADWPSWKTSPAASSAISSCCTYRRTIRRATCDSSPTR